MSSEIDSLKLRFQELQTCGGDQFSWVITSNELMKDMLKLLDATNTPSDSSHEETDLIDMSLQNLTDNEAFCLNCCKFTYDKVVESISAESAELALFNQSVCTCSKPCSDCHRILEDPLFTACQCEVLLDKCETILDYAVVALREALTANKYFAGKITPENRLHSIYVALEDFLEVIE